MAIDESAPTAATSNPLSDIKLRWLEGRFRVCRLGPREAIPEWALRPAAFVSITRTADELSIVTEEKHVPPEMRSEGPFAAMAVVGPLDFGIVGLLARLTGILAVAQVSVFVVSTFDTDVVLVPTSARETVLRALGRCFHADRSE